jgi:hypothetical protein
VCVRGKHRFGNAVRRGGKFILLSKTQTEFNFVKLLFFFFFALYERRKIPKHSGKKCVEHKFESFETRTSKIGRYAPKLLECSSVRVILDGPDSRTKK